MRISINPIPLDNSTDIRALVSWGRAQFTYGDCAGNCVAAVANGALCWLDIAPNADSVDTMLRYFRATEPVSNQSSRGEFLQNDRLAQATLDDAFAAPRRGDELQLYASGTDFQLQVWRALAQTKPGERQTYGELARRIGRPGAARAVGSAAAANVIALFIPCHRLVPAGGRSLSAGAYRWGAALKQKLLDAEHSANHISVYGQYGTDIDSEIHVS